MRISSVFMVFLLVPALARGQEQAIEGFVQRCHEGEAVACTTAGARYELGRGAPQSVTLAVDLYTRGCTAGAMPSCGLLGALYADGRGTPVDDARAVSLFQQACAGAHEHSCGQLGRMMVLGRGISRDIAGAAPFLDRGCTANHAAACEVLGRMLLGGLGVPRDLARGQTLLQRACAAGRSTACTAAATTTTGTYAAPPPVTDVGTFAAPPPVTGVYAAPPPVTAALTVPSTAPPRVSTAPPRVVSAPPRVVYVPRTRVVLVPRPESGVSPGASSVSGFGGQHRASMFFLGGETSVLHGPEVGDVNSFRLGFRHSRGPIEFAFDARYTGGTLAQSAARSRSWSSLAMGTQLGLNLLSWPRSDRERFSVINLSGGVEAALAFSGPSGGEALRVGGYVANTTYFLCWLGVRAEFTGSLVGANTWGHTFSASLFFGGRPSYMCR